MRRSTVLLFAALALVLAACQIRTDYGLIIEADTSAELGFEISYDGEAAQLLGPAQSFLEEEVEADFDGTIDGVTLLEATADGSDPNSQRVFARFAAEDGDALDRLLDDLFPGSSFTNVSGSTWQLTLETEDDVGADFGDDFPMDGFMEDFISGEFRVAFAGNQVSMQGGTEDGRNQIVWNPFGGENLELVVDLGGGGGPPALDEPADEPAEEPDPEEAAPEDDPVAEDSTEVEEEPAAEDEEAQDDAAVTTTDDGLSTLVLAAIAGGVLLLLLLLLLLLRGRSKRKKAAEQAATVPAGDPSGWAPPTATAAAPQSSAAPSSWETQPMPPAGGEAPTTPMHTPPAQPAPPGQGAPPAQPSPPPSQPGGPPSQPSQPSGPPDGPAPSSPPSGPSTPPPPRPGTPPPPPPG